MYTPALPQNDFRVVPLSHFARGGRWRTEAMRSYTQPLLIWFTKGQGRMTVSGITRGYGPHNAVFVPAGTMHGFDMLGQVFGSIIFFPYEADLDLPVAPLHLRFREANQHMELTGLIDHIQRECDAALPGHHRALLNYGGLLSVWLQRQAEKMPDAEMADDASRRLAAAFSALAERDFHLGKSVATYAAELGVTPTHLSRVCNIACGRPASSILAERVHFEARRLLRETRTPVKDIAEHLGFHSAAYFTRAFHKQSGKTPSTFRNAG
jgi:AraC family transcriptional regulator, transcriptional activator of pobA